MPNPKQIIESLDEQKEILSEPKYERPEQEPKKGHYRITQSRFELGDDGKWNKKSQDTYYKRKDVADTILSNAAQPFESSHRLYKQGKGRLKNDTYETIDQEGKQKSVWYVEHPDDWYKEESGFPYTEEVSEYNDRYGAKTHSERNLNLHAKNDRDMRNYISNNLPDLIEKAEMSPQAVASLLVRHASPTVRSDIDTKNVSPEYVKKLLNGFAEDISDKDEPFTEKVEDYNDYYGAKTRSEREFNLETVNDEKMHNYILANKDRLLRYAKYYPKNVANDIIRHGKYPYSFYGIDPKNIRKDYLISILQGLVKD